ncbi:hypothetical protein TNCV_2735441 [Trichonephila clavipes]|nr:hypothetical protein TNCV_2735441 [Trichonephila clavipes]
MLDHLEDTIHRVIADIRPQMLEKVIENWTSRLDYIRASRGIPMPEIIFKMEKNNNLCNALKTPSAENAISATKLFGFPAKILIIEPVLPYILEEWISKNIPAKYCKNIPSKLVWCGVVVRRRGCQLRCRPHHLTMVQSYVIRC